MWKGGSQVDGARLLPVVCSDRTRDNRHKIEHSKLYKNTRKNFKGDRALEQAAQIGHGVSGDIQNPPGLLPVWPAAGNCFSSGLD